MERVVNVTKDYIIKRREEIYKKNTQNHRLKYKEIAFIIRSYDDNQNDGYSLNEVKSFCKNNRIRFFEPKDEFVGETKIEQVVGTALLCDFGIVILPKEPNENVGLEIGLLIALSKPIFILKGRGVSRKLPFDYESYVYISHKSTAELKEKLKKKYKTHEHRHNLYDNITNEIVSSALKPLFESTTDQLSVALEKLGKSAKDQEQNISTFLDSWKNNPKRTLGSLERGMLLDIATRCGINIDVSVTETALVRKINKYLVFKIAEEKSNYIAYQGKHAIAEMLTMHNKRKKQRK
ncbi:MAG: hypothetical protein ACTSQE_10770 [Candidatus Heimdallarchaeaceae archaeon]